MNGKTGGREGGKRNMIIMIKKESEEEHHGKIRMSRTDIES